MKWESSIMINQPVERVFSFVIDPDIGSKWHRANKITPLSEGPIGIGSTFRVTGRFLFWRFDNISEVSEFEENRLITYLSDNGMYKYVLRYKLEPMEGGTLFTEVGEADPKGFLKLAINLFGGGAKGNSERGLVLLKNELEGSN